MKDIQLSLDNFQWALSSSFPASLAESMRTDTETTGLTKSWDVLRARITLLGRLLLFPVGETEGFERRFGYLRGDPLHLVLVGLELALNIAIPAITLID